MSNKTTSEAYFEKLCENFNFPWERIRETDSQTPDYRMKIGEQVIIVEVKEIAKNKEEQESEKSLYEKGILNVISCKPGERVRKKINDASRQIKKELAQGKYPSLLVLFEDALIKTHLDPYFIRVGMYGFEQYHIEIPSDPSISPYITGMSYGSHRKMTENTNTSISAIGVLSVTTSEEPTLCIYHNKFAAIPLEPSLLPPNIRQFKLEESPKEGKTAIWEEIKL